MRAGSRNDHGRLRSAAEAVIEHLELCGMRVVRRALAPQHGTLDPPRAPRESDAEDAPERL